MKIINIIIVSIFINTIFGTACKAQIKNDLSVAEISQRTADTIARREFAKLVAGTEDIPNIANYISFVPSDGKFALSGNYFFQTQNHDSEKKKRYEYFAVGFNGAGSIIGGNAATLFEKGKLNTGVDLGIRISWRMNTPVVASLMSDSYPMNEKRSTLVSKGNQKIDSIKIELQLVPLRINQINLSISETEKEKVTLSETINDITNSLNLCQTNSCKLKLTDSLIASKRKLFKEDQKLSILKNDKAKLEEIEQLISIAAGTSYENRTPRQRELTQKYGLKVDETYEDMLIKKVVKEYGEKIYTIELSRPSAGITINWLSLITNWNRKTFRTYNSSIAYSDALVKENFDGMTLGIQSSFYKFNKPFRKARLFNIALQYKRTNNLDDLTPSKLVEETSIPNNSTVRKSNVEYSVYTDPVEIYSTWQLPVNYYRFFGKDLKFGWHIFGLADWRNNGKNIYDIGTGFIFGLNSAGMKRLFNIELFMTYKDIKQDLVEENKTLWNQMQIGLSVAVPFLIYKH